MNRRFAVSLVAAAACIAGGLSSAARAGLLVNQSFESSNANIYTGGGAGGGTFGFGAGWVATIPNQNPNQNFVQTQTGAATRGFDGTTYAQMGTFGTAGTNSLATAAGSRVAVNVGTAYSLTFQYRGSNSWGATAAFAPTVTIDWFDSAGAALAPTTAFPPVPAAGTTATFTFSGVAPAGTATAGVKFASTQAYSLDNFDLAAVPEPTAAGLVGATSMLFAARRPRRA